MATSSSSISSKSETTDQIFAFQESGWDLQNITDKKVTATFLKYFRAFVEDAARRTDATFNGEKNNARQAMNKGAWYANSYCNALIKHEQKARLDFFKKKGNFYHGLTPKGFSYIKPSVKNNKPGDDNALTLFTGLLSNRYILQQNVPPSEGLDNLLPLKNDKVYFIDCQMAVEISWYCTLRETFGESAFNKHFNPKGSYPLQLSYNVLNTPLCPFLEAQKSSNPLLGDSCFFNNVPFYAPKHPFGDAPGLHVACVEGGSSPKYIGFGLLPSPKSEEQGVGQDGIFQLFADEFNKKPYELEELFCRDLVDKYLSTTRQDTLSPEKRKALDNTVHLNGAAINLMAKVFQKGKVGLIPELRRLSSEKIKEFLRNG